MMQESETTMTMLPTSLGETVWVKQHLAQARKQTTAATSIKYLWVAALDCITKGLAIFLCLEDGQAVLHTQGKE